MKRAFGILCLIVLTLVMVSCSSASSAGTTWQEQYDLGMQYLTEGDYEAAIVAFTAAIEIDAKDIQAYTGLVQSYIGTGDYESAVATAEQGAEVLADSDQVQTDGAADEFIISLFMLGEVCLDDEMYETTETIYSLIIGIDEKLVDACIGRAEIYLLLGEQEKALEDYRKALELMQQGETGSITEEELEALIAEIESSYMDDDASAETETAEENNYVLIEEYYVYADGTQELACEYTHDESGTILTKTTYELGPDGTYVTEYFYIKDNEELPSTLHVVDDNGKTVWSEEYIYDDEGNLITTIFYTDDVETDRDVYAYDNYGSVLSHFEYYNGELYRSYNYEYTYDLNGNVLSCTMKGEGMESSTYRYTYDDNGNVLSIIDSQYDQVIRQYTYDENENMLSQVYNEYNVEKEQVVWSSMNVYTYDDHGNVLSILYTSYNAEGQVSNQSGAYYTYDETGNVLSKYYDYGDDMYVYVYDNEKLILETYYVDGDEVTRTEYSYDEVGNILAETCYSNDGTLRYVHEYIYAFIVE